MTSSRARTLVVASLAVASLLAPACAATPKPVGITEEASAKAATKPASKTPSDSGVPKPLPSRVIAIVPERTLGPFVARRGNAAIAAYVAGSEQGARRLVTVALGDGGEPKGQPRVLGAAAGETNSLVVRATGGGSAAGFVAAITALTDRGGESLTVFGIADDGSGRAPGAELARTTDDIVWTEVVPTARGAICFWAEETRANVANILAVSLDPDGKPRGVPSHVAKGVTGWQAIPTTMGAALALVTPSTAPGDAAKKLGSLTLVKVDAEARAVAAPLTISPKPTVGGDFEFVSAADGFLFAWTDRSGLDPEVIIASVDASGSARAPSKPVSPVGGSSLVGLASGKAGTVLAWDEPSKRAHPTRRVHLTNISAGNTIDAGVVVEIHGNAPPELVATNDGYALLAPLRACTPSDNANACSAVLPMPTFVRFDAKLAVTQTEALRLPELKAAALAWALDCATERCFALVAPNESPTPILAVDLVKRPTVYRSPVLPPVPPDAARATALATLASGDAYADLAITKVGDTSLLALVTAAVDDPASPKKGPSSGAALTVRALDAGGVPQASTTLTTRALTVGGVAMAAGATPEDGAAVAWVAREGGDPQVHLTKVDRRGRKTGDVLVTTEKGDASDVAVAQVPGGFLVTWVDGRDGNGEVYAARVSSDLKVSPHERITKAPGDASDLVALATKDAVWIAWADPRESPNDGFADIFVTSLDRATGKRVSDETRVLPTAAHSRSPVLAATPTGVALAWIEDAPLSSDQGNASHGAMFAWLDAKGRPVRDPIRTRGAGDGAPTAVTLDVSPSGALRGILARSTREELVLDALDLSPTAPPRAYALLGMSGPPSFDVSLKLFGDALYYSDGGSEPEDNRARRLTLSWK